MNVELKRAVSVEELLQRRFEGFEFTGEWKDFIGVPEKAGAWLIWGGSGQGKTHFALKMAKYLSQFGKVLYNPLEEGISMSLRKAAKHEGISSDNPILFLQRESIPLLKHRLRKRRSANIIIIDSLQYTGLSYEDYKELREEFPRKLFIFISHAEGKEPSGGTAKSIRYDVDVKIYIQGYKAFAQSRFGGGTPFIIWEEGAGKYWTE